MKREIIDDTTCWLTGSEPGALGAVKMGRHVALLIVAPDADKALHVKRVLGTVWSPSADFQPDDNDASAGTLVALATHAASGRALQKGEQFAVRIAR